MATTSITEHRTNGRGRIKSDSSPTRILEGLLLARDRRDEFTKLEDGSVMVPSRSRRSRHNATADTCTCEDREYGRFRCSHSVAVLALEVARAETRGRGFEQDLRVEAVLDLMVRVQRPAPKWADVRWVEVEAAQIADAAWGLVGVSEGLRSMIAGAAVARGDLAFLEVTQ